MDETKFCLRPFADADYDAFSAILRVVQPESPSSPETLRHQDQALAHRGTHRRYAVDHRITNDVVGVGGLTEDPNQGPGTYWIFAFVRPESQAQGIGSCLFERLQAEAIALGGRCLRASTQEQASGTLAFLEKRGFHEKRRSWQSVLDLSSAETARLPSLREELGASGIEIRSLAEEGGTDPSVIAGLHRLDTVTSGDEPRIDPYVPWSLDEFRRLCVQGPNALPEAWFVAKHRGTYVGVSYALREPAEPETLLQGYTGTLREYRRRGLALALKLTIIDYGRRMGYRRLRTNNDATNAPMWTLNQRLGFRRTTTWIHTEKRLDVAPA